MTRELSAGSRERIEGVGRSGLLALYSIVRNARVHAEDNDAFDASVTQLGGGISELIRTDGVFDLRFARDGLYLNRQAIRLDVATTRIFRSVRADLFCRGVHGIAARAAPDGGELRRFVRLFTTAVRALGAQGDPASPLAALSLVIEDPEQSESRERSNDVRLIDAYSHAVFFVSRSIAQLRGGKEALPVWAASRLMQDFVDLEEATPARFLHLAHCKAGGDAYYGYHCANVAVLSIAFGARLGLSRNRRHDLGMAALFHDIGVAAVPSRFLNSEDEVTERELAAMRVLPIFAARAILRDREVHTAALDRARAAYDCHSDLTGARSEAGRKVGALGAIIAIAEAFDALTTTRPFRGAFEPAEAVHLMEGKLSHRFDAGLLVRFVAMVEPLLV
jgi:hypothetical protein